MNTSFFLFPEDLNSTEKRARDPAKVTLKCVTLRFVVQLRKIICVFNGDVLVKADDKGYQQNTTCGGRLTSTSSVSLKDFTVQLNLN